MDVLLIMVCATAALAGILMLSRQRIVARVRDRLISEERPDHRAETFEGARDSEWLHAWLVHAGYRRRSAQGMFITAAVACAVLGVAAGLLLSRLGLVPDLALGLESMPGGVGLALVPVIRAAPVFLGCLIAAVPWLMARRQRRQIIASVERDLPIFLELLATLVESGLAFDAAVAQLLDSEPEPHQLAREMRLFQLEIRSGRSRLHCFQRLRDRVDAPSLTVLVSALITAEQLGASIADVLRTQAEDIRNRRREQALGHAQTAPVKLVFPLIVCFLPGLFVSTLGPAFYQVFQTIDKVIGGR
jgi:tight adherence protein C